LLPPLPPTTSFEFVDCVYECASALEKRLGYDDALHVFKVRAAWSISPHVRLLWQQLHVRLTGRPPPLQTIPESLYGNNKIILELIQEVRGMSPPSDVNGRAGALLTIPRC
jgi:hypothetical protein